MKTYRDLFGSVPMMQHSLARRGQWDDHLSTDDPSLDAQERAIFDWVGVIDQLWHDRASVEQFRGAVEAISGVLEGHFRYEERMLLSVGYPDLRSHADEHREILADLALIRTYLRDGHGLRQGSGGLRLSNFMLGLTMGHIRNADSAYRRYIDIETERCSTGCA